MIATMKSGISKIRNPVIARVFRELDLVEQWGSGVRRIFEHAAAEHLPEPEIQEIGMRLRFTVRLEQPVPVERPANIPTGPGAQSGAQSQRILYALADTPLAAGEIGLILQIESKSGAFKRSLKQLLDGGLIEQTIPKKPNSRLQKYRLTPKGRKWVGEVRL